MSDPLPSPPAPRWLTLLAGIVGLWALTYLFLYNGGFDGATVDENTTFAAAGGGDISGDPIAAGRKIYRQNCAACHGLDGKGLAGQYPALAGSEIVLSKEPFGENHLVWIVLDGLVGPVQVAGGATCNNVMVPWKAYFNDEKMAALLSYVRQEWGNGASPIPPEAVAQARAESSGGARAGPWTVPMLLQHPAAVLKRNPPAPAAPMVSDPVPESKESGTPR